ncbi:MAG: hypothetical protein ACXVEB_16115 [Bacteroidia bacterium]
MENKKILLIAAKFFGYENDIKAELLKRGFSVDMVHDRPFNSASMKALTKLFPRLMQFIVQMYYESKFPHIFEKNYDIIFVIEGITLAKSALKRLREKNPQAQFILYVWDSVANRHHILDYKNEYDQVFTFDPDDAKKYQVQFRPLFYTEDFERKEPAATKYDVEFVGTVHSDRYPIISKILNHLQNNCRKFIFLYFHTEWFFLYNRFTKSVYKNAHKSEFQFKPISKKEVAAIIASSFVTIDIEHPSQVGLTIRTFEVLGVRRKLATTNSSIKDYDFYDPQNILVLDRNNPVIPEDFFKTEYKELPANLYYKYSLKGWVDEVLSL